ncbi:hypothetical protein LK07_01595 [Streptomyces pluripotens]|uniref:Uncharacterized protein n=1 Tax=Streptomyces pluripotens TaxID=1355015 RepID=A0A221NSP2_9ACTN|nr:MULTISPECIES: hypothetical protein [Streptomyces]ARP68674.1 hypothetical protein LK06_000520 [Streptomyces pluripotens]ASN22932.1 hypothetical protein LK07_01595 [Streptomyces pluripotens]KIE26698.1 hypothetical protein LK08_12265 [Streptomyces sp. MUSC 125]MCH0559230.1 hypothetical protein [Streptomyces sp. MUM 16J]
MSTQHVRRSYSFVCLECGHGWESAFEVDVTVDRYGRIEAAYHLGGERVPSPLQSPKCVKCESGKIRIMRPGRVTGARLHEG